MHDVPTPYRVWFHDGMPSHETWRRFVDDHFSESDLKDIITWLKNQGFNFGVNNSSWWIDFPDQETAMQFTLEWMS